MAEKIIQCPAFGCQAIVPEERAARVLGYRPANGDPLQCQAWERWHCPSCDSTWEELD